MVEADEYERLSRALVERFAQTPGAHGLIFAGSSAKADRRDRWSDHDFLALVESSHAAAARESVDWLPDPERVAHVAREGDVGFVAIYDDGHLLEFALASVNELSDAPLTDSAMAVGDGRAVEFWARARQRGALARAREDAADETALFLAKILVGYGRARRGERVSAQRFIRGWAVDHLLRAVRLRLEPARGADLDPLDPSRRLERAYPRIAGDIDLALAQPVEPAARRLLALARQALEPGWAGFPARAAAAVEYVLDSA